MANPFSRAAAWTQTKSAQSQIAPVVHKFEEADTWLLATEREESAQAQVQMERIYANLPTGVRAVQFYVDSGKGDRQTNDYLSNIFDRQSKVLGVDRQEVGQKFLTGLWGTYGQPDNKLLSWTMGQLASDLGIDFEVPGAGFDQDVTQYLKEFTAAHMGLGQQLETGMTVPAASDLTIPPLTRVQRDFPELFAPLSKWEQWFFKGAKAGIALSSIAVLSPALGAFMAEGLLEEKLPVQPVGGAIRAAASPGTDLLKKAGVPEGVAEPVSEMAVIILAGMGLSKVASVATGSKAFAQAFPIRGPGLSAAVQGLKMEDALKAADTLARKVLKLTNKDIGKNVSLYGKGGTVVSVKRGVAEIRLWEGGVIHVPADQVLKMPLGGSSLTVGSEASLLRGEAPAVHEALSPEALGAARPAPTANWSDPSLLTSASSPIRTGKWAALSADRPGMTPQQIAEATDKLVADLKAAGYKPIVGTGKFEGVEAPSVIVPGMDDQAAVTFGRRFGQDYAFTNTGLVNTRTGFTSMADTAGTKFGAGLTNNYTEIVVGGKPVRFSVPLSGEERFPATVRITGRRGSNLGVGGVFEVRGTYDADTYILRPLGGLEDDEFRMAKSATEPFWSPSGMAPGEVGLSRAAREAMAVARLANLETAEQATARLEQQATRAKAAKTVDDVIPLVFTPGGLDGTPLGNLLMHGTSTAEDIPSKILRGGLQAGRPAPADPVAVYLTSQANTVDFYAGRAVKLLGGEKAVIYVETPLNLTTIPYQEALGIGKQLGLRGQKLTNALLERGYQAMDMAGAGGHKAGDIALLDPTLARPLVGASAHSSWSDFTEVAMSVMRGDANVLILNPVAGGADPYTPALQALASFVMNTDFDRQQLLLSISRGAKTVEMPEGTLGKFWAAGQRLFNPSVGKTTKEAFFAAYNHRQLEQLTLTTRILFLKKAITEALGPDYLKNIEGTPFRNLFRGVVPDDPAEARVVGSFADMMEYIEQYDVPATWRDLAVIWKTGLDSDFALTQKMGYPGELLDMMYIPHRQSTVEPSLIDRFLQERAGGGKMPAGLRHPGFTRERKYISMREWSKFLSEHGGEPELDPFKLYASRLGTTANLRVNQVYIQGVLQTKNPVTGKLMGQPIPKGETPLSGYVELFSTPTQGTNLPGVRTGRWSVPRQVAVEMNSVMSRKGEGAITDAVSEGVDLARGTLLSTDFSWVTQQGYALALMDPVNFVKSAGKAARVAMTEEGFLLDFVQNAESYAFYVRSGGTMYASPADIVPLLGAKHLIDRTPVIGWFNQAGFGRFLPYLKRKQFESTYQQLLNLQQGKGLGGFFAKNLPFLEKLSGVEGKTPEELAEVAADVVANIGGGVNWGRLMTNPSLASKLVLLTEGWVRANMGRIINLGKVGDPKGLLARQWMFKALGITSMLSTTLSLMIGGRLPNYDPLASDFLDVQTPTGSVPILPGKTYIRTILRVIAGRPGQREGEWDWSMSGRGETVLRFWEQRTGQGIRMSVDMSTGKDALGRNIDNRALHFFKSLLPLPAQGVADMFTDPSHPGWENAVTQFLGLNFIPTHPVESRDSHVKTLHETDPLSGDPVTSYFQMTEAMRKAYDAKYPEYTQAVREWQGLYDRPSNEANKLREVAIAKVSALGKAYLGQALTPEESASLGPADYTPVANNPVLYAQMLEGIQGEYFAGTAGLYDEELPPEGVANTVVRDYYKTVVEPAIRGTTLDYEAYATNEEAFRAAVEAKWGDWGLAVLDSEMALHSTDDPIAASYHRDATAWKDYYRYRNSVWTPENLEAFGMDPTFAKDYNTFDAWQTGSRVAFKELFAGKPLPAEVGLMKYENGDTLFKRLQVPQGQSLTEQKADEVADELTRLWAVKYQKALTYNSENWLIGHTEVLCNMAYWGKLSITERLEPYTNLCSEKFSS